MTNARKRSDHAPADIGRKALARAAQVRRVDARKVVPPETHLRDGRQADEEDAPLRERQPDGWHQQEHERQQHDARELKDVQQLAPADDDRGEIGEERRVRPARPSPGSVWTPLTVCSCAVRSSVRTCSRPGTTRGIC